MEAEVERRCIRGRSSACFWQRGMSRVWALLCYPPACSSGLDVSRDVLLSCRAGRRNSLGTLVTRIQALDWNCNGLALSYKNRVYAESQGPLQRAELSSDTPVIDGNCPARTDGSYKHLLRGGTQGTARGIGVVSLGTNKWSKTRNRAQDQVGSCACH